MVKASAIQSHSLADELGGRLEKDLASLALFEPQTAHDGHAREVYNLLEHSHLFQSYLCDYPVLIHVVFTAQKRLHLATVLDGAVKNAPVTIGDVFKLHGPDHFCYHQISRVAEGGVVLVGNDTLVCTCNDGSNVEDDERVLSWLAGVHGKNLFKVFGESRLLLVNYAAVELRNAVQDPRESYNLDVYDTFKNRCSDFIGGDDVFGKDVFVVFGEFAATSRLPRRIVLGGIISFFCLLHHHFLVRFPYPPDVGSLEEGFH